MSAANEPRSRCDNCGGIFFNFQLKEVSDLLSRVQPGETMPSGDCPKCGALCFPHHQSLIDEHLEAFITRLLDNYKDVRRVVDDQITQDHRWVLAVRKHDRVNDWDEEPIIQIIPAAGMRTCQKLIETWGETDSKPLAVCELFTGISFDVHVSPSYRMSSKGESVMDT